MKKVVISVLLFTLTLSAGELKIATAQWAPYAYEENATKKGVALNIVKKILNHSNQSYAISLYPAKRLNALFEYKKIDINFADSPLWNKQNKDIYFTEPYMYVREYIYTLSSSDLKIDSVKSLKGKTVGVEMGYYYADLEKSFQDGSIIKDEAPNTQSLINKLLGKRGDAIIMDERLFSYTIKKLGLEEKNFKKSLKLTDAPLCMKLGKEHKNLLPILNNSILSLR